MTRKQLIQKALEIMKANPLLGDTEVAKELLKLDTYRDDLRALRKSVAYWRKKYLPEFNSDTETDTNQYEEVPVLSARKPNGDIMSVKEFCDHYNLPYNEARSYKLLTHTKYPTYNIASHYINERGSEGQISLEEIKVAIEKGLEHLRIVARPIKAGKKVTVVNLSDLHFGAYIDGLVRTKNFSVLILADYLKQCAAIVNDERSDQVQVHITGDLIESFTGLNHKNSWKQIEHGMVGAEVVKACCKVLHEEFFSQIDNLGAVKIVAGNHDRVTSDSKEDTEGGAANLISWGLQLIGYDVEFHPYVISTEVDGISYILMHGNHTMSKSPTKDICWDFGKQGMFNVVLEGHLHSYIQKASVQKLHKLQTISDSSVSNIRLVLPSLFTGNLFSEHLGYTSLPGFVITRNNGSGIPHILQYSLQV